MAPPAVPAHAVILRPRVDGIPVPHFRKESKTKRPKEAKEDANGNDKGGKHAPPEPKRNAAGVLIKKMPKVKANKAVKRDDFEDGDQADQAKAKARVQVKKMPEVGGPAMVARASRARSRSPSSSSSSFRVEAARPSRPSDGPLPLVSRKAAKAPWSVPKHSVPMMPPQLEIPEMPEWDESEWVVCDCCGVRFTVEEWEVSWTWEHS